MDPSVMAMLQKSISARLCPTVLGQACMDLVVNHPEPGEESFESWSKEKEAVKIFQLFYEKYLPVRLKNMYCYRCWPAWRGGRRWWRAA